MRKKTRKIIFIFGLLLFFIITPLLLLYSQGIRISFGEQRILRTGGFYFNVLQNSVEIYLNGSLQEKTGIWGNSVLIRNLPPQKYDIEIKKAGYFPWQKTLEIKEGEVVQAKNILLTKEGVQFKVLKRNVEDFLVSEDGGDLLLKESNEEGWRFIILNLLTLREREIFSEREFKGKAEITPVAWREQEKEILLESDDTGIQKFFILNYDFLPEKQFFNLTLPGDIKKISFAPTVKGEVLYLLGNNLIRKNFDGNQREEIFLPGVVWFEIQNGNLFWLSDSGFLLKSGFNGERKEILNKKPLSLKQGGYDIRAWKEEVLVTTPEDLYLFTKDGKLNKIFDEVMGFEISPNLAQTVFWQENEIWLLKEFKGEKVTLFLNRFSKSPQSIFWLTPHYLLFKLGDEIKITEIDNRDYLNMVNLGEFKNPEIFFNQGDEKLYILSENILYVSEKLVP